MLRLGTVRDNGQTKAAGEPQSPLAKPAHSKADHVGRPRLGRLVEIAVVVGSGAHILARAFLDSYRYDPPVSTLRLRIEGEPGVLGVPAFITAVRESHYMLLDLDAGVSGVPRGTLEWSVASLKTGSAVIEMESRSRSDERNVGPEVTHLFVTGLEQLERLGTTPPYLTETGMLHARRLLRLIGRNGMAGLQVSDMEETATISAKAAANIEPLLKARRRSLGSVEGRIETASIHGRARFIIYLTRTRKAVTCRLSTDALMESVSNVLGRRVLASGTVHYNARGEPLRVEVDHLRVMRSESELPGIDELAGSEPDFTGGQSTGDYIRELRSA
jgi:hypothetical protein